MVEYKKKDEVFGIYGIGFQTMGGAMLCFRIEHTWDTLQNRVKEEKCEALNCVAANET